MLNIFKYTEIKYSQITTKIEDWLRETHNKANILFSSASPFGQLLGIVKEIYYMNLLSIKNILSQLDIEKTLNPKVLRFISIISGHNQSRPISATGVLNFKVKPNAGLTTTSNMTIPNKTLIRNKSNNLYYTLITPSDDNIYTVDKNTEFFIRAVQGKYNSETFTGDGTILQSYSINSSGTQLIENFNIEVYYNGEKLDIKKHLFDMTKDEKSCYIKSGFNGGIDIFFGTEYYGFSPEIASTIEVKYLITNGTDGNIYNNVLNDWIFVDTIYTKNQEIVDVEDIFNITVQSNFNFSSDGENYIQTKSIIPYVSRNFVLSTEDQFKYHLKRLNMFNTINVYTKFKNNNNYNDTNISDSFATLKKYVINSKVNKEALLTKISSIELKVHDYKYKRDNTIYIDLVPKLDLYLNSKSNYFDIPMKAFVLDTTMKDKIQDYLKTEGTMTMTTDIQINSPKVNRFISYIYIRRIKGYEEEVIKNSIIGILSDYMVNYERNDRIIRSDLIKTIKSVDGIDSVDLYFVNEKNEKLHIADTTTNTLLGLDPLLGDLVMENGELTVMRGGWSDRNGIYYQDDISSKTSMNAVNIIFNGVTEK